MYVLRNILSFSDRMPLSFFNTCQIFIHIIFFFKCVKCLIWDILRVVRTPKMEPARRVQIVGHCSTFTYEVTPLENHESFIVLYDK